MELLVIQGTIISAEHVQADGQALNLKSFIADLDVPVIAGGCTNYQTAIHLMRTGAAGVIVGTGDGATSTTDDVLGIAVPMATAIADAAAARRAYLDETGGRYVHVIAAGGIHTSADVAKAIACGADAVMLGEPLTWSARGARRGLVLADHHRAPGGAARVRRPVRPGRRAARTAAARPGGRCGRPDQPVRRACAARWRRPATPTSRSSRRSGCPSGREPARPARADPGRPARRLPAVVAPAEPRLPLCTGAIGDTRHHKRRAARTWRGGEPEIGRRLGRSSRARPEVEPPRRSARSESSGTGERSVVRRHRSPARCAGGMRDHHAVLGVDQRRRAGRAAPHARSRWVSNRETGTSAPTTPRNARPARTGTVNVNRYRSVPCASTYGPSMCRSPDAPGTLNQSADP